MNLCIVEKDINEIELIKPLWEQLNRHHFEKSVNFKGKYDKFTFEMRLESIYRKANSGIIRLDMIVDNDSGCYVGYCLSSIEGNIGEIESLFIESQFRKFKMGDKLMRNALAWFEANSITNIQIGVAYGNDEALPFYERYGFHVGNYILKRS